MLSNLPYLSGSSVSLGYIPYGSVVELDPKVTGIVIKIIELTPAEVSRSQLNVH